MISSAILASLAILTSPDNQSCESQFETGTDAPFLFRELVQAINGGSDSRSDFAEAFNFEDGEQLDLIAMVAGSEIEIVEYLWCFDDTVAARISTSSPDNTPILFIDATPGSDASIDRVGLRAGTPETTPEPLDPAIRDDVILSLAAVLQEGYIMPDVGLDMAEQLRGYVETGRYDRLTRPQALALRLTEDLKDTYTDRHLRIYTPDAFEDRLRLLSAPDDDEAPVAEGILSSRPISFGEYDFTYLGFQGRMIETESLLAQIEEDFSASTRSDGLILDLRNVPGGDGTVMRAMASPLYSEPTDLLVYQSLDVETGEISEEPVQVSGTGLSYSENIPVYVLINSQTGSAAESLAFALKRSGRAIIVGETSAGAGHLVTGVALDHGFGVDLPIGRAIDPRTGDSWEAVGVRPDVEVDEQDALPEALRLLTDTDRLPELHSHS